MAVMYLQVSGVNRNFFSELESVRGIAILLVLVFHSLPFAFDPKPQTGPLSVFPLRIFYEGHTGVSLFLVLSAFLLSLPYWRHLHGGKRPEAVTFYYRRALRILPLYYSAVIVAALVMQDWDVSLQAFLFWLQEWICIRSVQSGGVCKQRYSFI